MNTEDEKSKEQISNVPLPVMLSRYVNTWNIDSSKKGTNSKRTGSVLKSQSKKSKRAKHKSPTFSDRSFAEYSRCS